ncbi:MAG: hypothetical protein ACTSQF_05865 [Candidatus Heimdallarchaeaceae archaeon]
MVLERVEIHCAEEDTPTIISTVKENLVKFDYRIKKPRDEYLDHYTFHAAKDLYNWVITFNAKSNRTGNIVEAEISRLEPFSISRVLAKRREKKQKNRVERSFFFLLRRFWWFYIIGGFAGSMVLNFIPGTTAPVSIVGYVLTGVLGSILIFSLANNLFIRYQRKHESDMAEILREQLLSIVESIDGKSPKRSILCWSCYKEVIPKKRKCPNCNVELVKQ